LNAGRTRFSLGKTPGRGYNDSKGGRMTLTVYFTDGFNKTFEVNDDEDATLKRDDLLEYGYQEKTENAHIYYPASAIVRIVVTSV
jgi:hypothetical protein